MWVSRAGSCLQCLALACWAMPPWQAPPSPRGRDGTLCSAAGYSPIPFRWQPQLHLTAPLPVPPLLPHRRVHLNARRGIGSSAALPHHLLPALPVGRSRVGCCSQDAGSAHGENLQGLVPNPSPGFAPAWSQVPAATGTPATASAPSPPCKHAGHDGTRRGDAASTRHRGGRRRRRAWEVEERTPREGEEGLE